MKKNQSKAAFILAAPRDIPAKEVVAKGKAAGLKFTATYVYTVRRKATVRATAAVKFAAAEMKKAAKTAPAARPGVSKVRPDTVAAFRKAAAEIGIGEALALLNSDAAVLAFYKAGAS